MRLEVAKDSGATGVGALFVWLWLEEDRTCMSWCPVKLATWCHPGVTWELARGWSVETG